MTGEPENIKLFDCVPIPQKKDYDIALRPDERGMLDDVVVNKPLMFRAEMMGDTELWMCCYMNKSHERVNFWVNIGEDGTLQFSVTEWPEGNYTYEEGSILE
jgi:hypothetical protein